MELFHPVTLLVVDIVQSAFSKTRLTLLRTECAVDRSSRQLCGEEKRTHMFFAQKSELERTIAILQKGILHLAKE